MQSISASLDGSDQQIFPSSKDNTKETFLHQASNFINTIDVAVNMLGPDMGVVKKYLVGAGVQNADCGFSEKQYSIMGKAFLETLEFVLKEDFSSETKNAWKKFLTSVSRYMFRGAQSSYKKQVVGRPSRQNSSQMLSVAPVRKS